MSRLVIRRGQGVTTPHDSLFRRLMADREMAPQFLAHFLPRPMAVLLGPKPPVLLPDTFVDESLREVRTDALLEVPLRNGTTIYPYILNEHKSQEERFTRLQLLGYITQILKRARTIRGDDALLPTVVPIVVYHGSAPWTHPADLEELLEPVPEEFRGYLTLRHEVVDLARICDEDLPEHKRLRTFLRLLQHSRDPLLAIYLRFILVDVESLTQLDLEIIYNYLDAGPINVTKEQFERALGPRRSKIMGHLTESIRRGILRDVRKEERANAQRAVQDAEKRTAALRRRTDEELARARRRATEALARARRAERQLARQSAATGSTPTKQKRKPGKRRSSASKKR